MEARLELIDKFRKVDDDIRMSLAQETSKLKLGLVTLTLAQEKFDTEYLSLDEIVEALDRMGVVVERAELGRAFSRAGDRLRRIKQSDKQRYKVMTPGKQFVDDLLGTSGPKLFYFEGGKPRTARKTLEAVFADLHGKVRICDPYYGLRTLDTLELLSRRCTVRFLTANHTDKPAALAHAVADFKLENPHIAIGIYPIGKEIHDRYVLTPEALLLVGHGIKDIGNKESFLVNLDKTVAQDVMATLAHVFDERWKKATRL